MLIVFGNGVAPTTGVSPLAEDPTMERVAPADCLLYYTWTGVTESNAGVPTANSTEKLYADPGFQNYVERASSLMLRIVASRGGVGNHGENDTAIQNRLKIFNIIHSHAGALFVSNFSRGVDGAPDLEGGVVIQIDGDDKEVLFSFIDSMLDGVPPDALSPVNIGEREFTRLELDGAPAITWGLNGDYLVIGIGEGQAAEIVARQESESGPPAWIGEARQRGDRTSTYEFSASEY